MPDPKPTFGISPYAVFNGNPILFNDPFGDEVRLHDQAVKEGTELKGYSTSNGSKNVGDYVVKAVYEKLQDGKVSGKIIGYQAYKDGRLDYEMDATDLPTFEKNVGFYSKTADGYQDGSLGMKKIGIGLGSGDLRYTWEGIKQENIDFFRNPLNVSLLVTGLGEMHVSPKSLLHTDVEAPIKENIVSTFSHDRHGLLTNGTYTVSKEAMKAHVFGGVMGKSVFYSTVNAEEVVLKAAQYADEAGLWVGNKAKVKVLNANIGILGNGKPANTVNVYRNSNGFIHGSPGN